MMTGNELLALWAVPMVPLVTMATYFVWIEILAQLSEPI